METGSSCLIGAAGCSEFGSNMGMGMLLLSLGITIALVGALFYYVRQRFEVLEVSHKEQIGVMQNFIASIGDQFHRMHSFIQQQGSIMFAGAEQQPQQPQPAAEVSVSMPIPRAALFSGGSLIDVSSDDDDDSDDSDSDYDDDSATSDTDAADFGGSIKIHDDIYIDRACTRSHADDDDDDDDDDASDDTNNSNKERTERDRASDIKIIELSAPRNRAAANDESDTDRDTDTDNYTDTDTDADADADADGADKVMNVTVIKSDSTYCEHASGGESLQQQQDASPPTESAAGTVASRSMAIDLDLGDLADIDIESISFSSIDAADDAAAISGDATVPAESASASGGGGENDKNKNKGGGAPYAQMSIKQLRKLVKFHNIDIHNNQDISKLKREQLLEILAAANVKT